MGENLEIGDRTSVRTPMQWTDDRNAGFSQAPPRTLPRAIPGDGFSPEHVNVSDQRHDPDSMLQFMRRLVERRRSSAEMGWGRLEIVEHDASSVLVHSLSGAEGRMVAIHNFSPNPASVSFTLEGVTETHELVDLLVDGQVLAPGPGGAITVQLDGYGYRWLRVIDPDGKRLG